MTCIANPNTYPSKKVFKAACAAGNWPRIEDPSVFAPWAGPLPNHPALREPNGHITVTNHPKRQWFAAVTRLPNGGLKVE